MPISLFDYQKFWNKIKVESLIDDNLMFISNNFTSHHFNIYLNRHEFIELGNSWPPQRHFSENTIFRRVRI